MAIFKCKMCGGALEINAGDSVAVCEYCNTKQTLPKLDDDKRAQLYDRANYFRRENEFDKAMGIYEMILSEDKEDCESYWGIVLCRYGIEYVEDPRSHKRIPTVNRAQFTSIFEDEDYKNAIKYADALQKEVYEAEANVIDKIQKGILAISQKEEPFDVFICYKETDSFGNRTQDSVYAQDIYNALTKEGYKVFFSRITLEDKLGSAYEPYIFAALNSAKVMLVVGTAKDNFNAVWVKNEWSRFISLIQSGKEKTLIPVYKDISPYEMPEEFQYLQSQDMSKIGFMQDLVRGVQKIIGADKPAVKETVVVNQANNQTAPLLERAFMFLEDGEWENADAYCEKVLDLEPQNALAYVGKLMVELRVKTQQELSDYTSPFNENSCYQKALRFADDNLKPTLEGYIASVNTNIENAQRDSIYRQAIDIMSKAKSEEAYLNAITLFEQIPGWRDSDEKVVECKGGFEKLYAEAKERQLERERIAEIERQKRQMRAKRNKKIAAVITPIVCVIVAFIVVLNTVIIPNNQYNDAVALMNAGKYQEAIVVFNEINGYKDSFRKIEECNTAFFDKKYNDAITQMKAGNIVEAYETFIALDGYKESEEKADSIFVEYKVEKLKKVGIGNYIFFGTYEQDNNTSNGKEDVEWLVLDKQDDKILVISKYGLDCKQYNTMYADVTWESCTLRKWLNDDFINTAFSDVEKTRISTVTVSADENPDYSTNPGNATQDKVFLLSITEANKYFNSDLARYCKPTDYAIAKGAYTYNSNDFSGGYWLLRSPGDLQSDAAYIRQDGSVNTEGLHVDLDSCAVRPAMWIDIS